MDAICASTSIDSDVGAIILSMANCYFAKPRGMQHCYIPFLYVIDFKGALNFGEA
jgi:hypothetical protein